MRRRDENVKIQNIDPWKIKVPKVRITSDFDPEILEMFQADIEKVGIQQPLLIAKSGEDYWVIDGLHRLQEAKQNGYKTVPCIVQEMDLKELQLRNLAVNLMRGKTKVSEEALVIRDLYENHGCEIEEITERTGISRERVEKLLKIGQCPHEVWQALDEGRIKVCHAYEISRLPDRDAQLRVLRLCEQYRPKCAEFKELIDETIRMIAEREVNEPGVAVEQPPKVPTAECHFCHGEFPVQQLSSPIMCMGCYGYLVAAIQEVVREREEKERQLREQAEQVIGGEKR